MALQTRPRGFSTALATVLCVAVPDAGGPARAAGAVHVVSTTADDAAAPPPGSLREAVEVLAAPGDTIRFDGPIEVKLVANLVVRKTLTGLRIEGPGGIAAVQPKTSGRKTKPVVGGVTILADDVVLTGLRFLDTVVVVAGSPSGDVEVPASRVTVSACRFSGTTGGVSLTRTDACTVSDCTFEVRRSYNAPAVLAAEQSENATLVKNTVTADLTRGRTAVAVVDGAGHVVEDNVLAGGAYFELAAGVVRRNRAIGSKMYVLGDKSGAGGHAEVANNEVGRLVVSRVDVDVVENVIDAAKDRSPVRKPEDPDLETIPVTSGLRVAAGSPGGATAPVRVLRNTVRNAPFGISYADVGGRGGGSLLEGNTVERAARTGLYVHANAPVTVRGNTITRAGARHRGLGIEVRSGTSGVTLEDNRVSDTSGIGISYTSGGGGTTSRRNVVTRSSREGVRVLKRYVYSEGDTVEDSGRDGVFVGAGSLVRVLAGTIRGNKGAGVYVEAGGFAEARRGSWSGNGGPGIDLAPRGVTPNARTVLANEDAAWPESLAFESGTRAVTGSAPPFSTVDLYAVESGPRKGNPKNGEGALHIGSAVADASGRFILAAGACPASRRYTLTTTVQHTIVPRTSEFSPDLLCEDAPAAELISAAPDGTPGDSQSNVASGFAATDFGSRRVIGGNGRFVVFCSQAGNLTPEPHNERDQHVYLWDHQTKTMRRVTQTSHGGPFDADFQLYNGLVGESPSVSEDGRFVAYDTHSNEVVPDDKDGFPTVVLFDAQSGTNTAIMDVGHYPDPTLPSGLTTFAGGYEPSISGDGSAVAFVSFGRDYAGGNDLGIDDDVFVWTRATGLISRVSVPTGGGDVDNGFNYAAQTPRLSHDARFVVFASHQHLTPGNTVTGLKVFLHDRQTGTTEIVSVDEQGVARTGRAPCLSDDGRLLAFTSNDRLVAADTDSVPDVHLRDRQAGTTVRVSVRTDGTPFPTQWCRDASMSGDGRFLSFTVNGKVAPPGQITQLLVDDVYLLDRTTGTVVEVSAGAYGESYSATNAAALSRDGTVLVFQTAGRNLDPRITDPYEAPLQVFRRPAGTR